MFGFLVMICCFFWSYSWPFILFLFLFIFVFYLLKFVYFCVKKLFFNRICTLRAIVILPSIKIFVRFSERPAISSNDIYCSFLFFHCCCFELSLENLWMRFLKVVFISCFDWLDLKHLFYFQFQLWTSIYHGSRMAVEREYQYWLQ